MSRGATVISDLQPKITKSLTVLSISFASFEIAALFVITDLAAPLLIGLLQV